MLLQFAVRSSFFSEFSLLSLHFLYIQPMKCLQHSFLVLIWSILWRIAFLVAAFFFANYLVRLRFSFQVIKCILFVSIFLPQLRIVLYVISSYDGIFSVAGTLDWAPLLFHFTYHFFWRFTIFFRIPLFLGYLRLFLIFLGSLLLQYNLSGSKNIVDNEVPCIYRR